MKQLQNKQIGLIFLLLSFALSLDYMMLEYFSLSYKQYVVIKVTNN